MFKFFGFLFGGFVLYIYIFFSALKAADPNSPETQKFMRDVHSKVAENSIKELELAIKSGDSAEICVRAGIVAAAYNQAHEEKLYLQAKKLQKKACDRHSKSFDQ